MAVLDDLADVFDAVHSLTGVSVCIYDFEHFLTYESGVFQKHFSGHYCAFCKAVRSLTGGRAACEKSDRIETAQLARQYRTPFFNVCHMGLTEYILPIIKEDTFIGLIFLGQCRIAGETDFLTVGEHVARLGGSRERFYQLYCALPVVSRAKLAQAGKLLDLAIKRLVDEQGEMTLALYIQNRPLSTVTRAVSILNSDYMSPISAKDISQKLHINQSYLSRLFKREMGCSMMEYLAQRRMEHAKNLIANTQIPISSIAFNVGYADQNYFSRYFKKVTGQSPTAFRITYQKTPPEPGAVQ